MEQNWKHWQKAGKAKRKLIRYTIRRSFCTAIYEAAKEHNGIWKLAKWRYTKAQDPNELPIMPALVTPQGNVAHTIQEKAEALQARFYPTVEADLSDIKETIFKDDSFSPNLIQISQEATKEDVESILRTTKTFRALGIDGITNRFL